MKTIIALVMLLAINACYVGHKASGTVKTENKVDAQIVINYPLCDNENWTYEQVMTCIDLCNDYRATIGADPELLEALNNLLEHVNDPDTKALIEGMIQDELKKQQRYEFQPESK